jgi:hypothetical protein
VVLAGGPLRTPPATLLVRSRLAGRLRVAGTLGGALLDLDPLDGGAGPLPVGPLGGVLGFGSEGPVRIGDVVAAPVVLDLGGGQAPGPPAPGRPRNRAQRLQDVAGAVGFGGEPGRSSLPGQGPHDLSVGGAEVGVGL